MKSLNINAILPWEFGLIIIIISLTVLILGVRQGRKKNDDFDNIPLIKPTTKILFGTAFLIFGLIQLLPLLK